MTDLSAEERARECLEQETGYGFYSQAEFDHALFKGAEVVRAMLAFEAAAIERVSVWKLPAEEMPPLHNQVLVELREGPGQVCDVACYLGKVAVDGGGSEDRWILADVRLDTRQIKRWAHIYPLPPKNELDLAITQSVEAIARIIEPDAGWDRPEQQWMSGRRQQALAKAASIRALAGGEG